MADFLIEILNRHSNMSCVLGINLTIPATFRDLVSEPSYLWSVCIEEAEENRFGFRRRAGDHS